MAYLPPGRVSRHFTEAELIASARHPELVQWPPPVSVTTNALVFATAVLEPWRTQVGPLKVNSWWRNTKLNRAVGGDSTSHHLLGAAADVAPLRMTRKEAWRRLIAMVNAGLPITEAIVYEAKSHIHVSYLWWQPIEEPELLVKLRRGSTVDWADYRGWLSR